MAKVDRDTLSTSFSIEPVGVVRSDLRDRGTAPRQGDEGAPSAWLELSANMAQGLAGISEGEELFVLTWFHLAQRDVLAVHPRNEPNSSLAGVFATRSPDRPNPVGLHRVTVLEVVEDRLKVFPLEAIDGTPIVDIKPVLEGGR